MTLPIPAAAVAACEKDLVVGVERENYARKDWNAPSQT